MFLFFKSCGLVEPLALSVSLGVSGLLELACVFGLAGSLSFLTRLQ